MQKTKNKKTDKTVTKPTYSYFKHHHKAAQLLEIKDNHLAFAHAPTPRVTKTTDFMHTMNNKPYSVNLALRGGEHKNIGRSTLRHETPHYVPVLLKAGANEPAHPRQNLFDMLSTHLDQHLLTFGIWQQISHEIEAYDAEEHEEISPFVAITSLGKPDYRMLGVMQYTFNKAGECYHRAFKPLLKTHVRRLSNSKTQWILQAAIYDLIQEAQKKPSTPSAEVLASFLNTFDKDEADALNAVMREIEKLTGY